MSILCSGTTSWQRAGTHFPSIRIVCPVGLEKETRKSQDKTFVNSNERVKADP